jgi:hypothetical protein
MARSVGSVETRVRPSDEGLSSTSGVVQATPPHLGPFFWEMARITDCLGPHKEPKAGERSTWVMRASNGPGHDAPSIEQSQRAPNGALKRSAERPRRKSQAGVIAGISPFRLMHSLRRKLSFALTEPDAILGSCAGAPFLRVRDCRPVESAAP